MAEDDFLGRMTALQKERGLTDRALSLMVTGKDDFIRDLRRKGSKPVGANMAKLAEALETTSEYLVRGRSTGAILGDRRTGYDAGPAPTAPLPRDLPVYGTAVGADLQFDRSDPIETHIVELTDAIDWVRRPMLLSARPDVYALYITGSSMEPRFEPGDPVIVDPKRPPSAGDDVIVQVRAIDGEEVKAALVKRLIKRTASRLELRQYNPPLDFSVPLERVAAVHRVVPLRDVIG